MNALPSHFNKLSILKQVPIFEGLNWFELNRIARRTELVEFNKGDCICKQGAPADAFYALVAGRAHSFRLNALGQKEEDAFILRGMHFGIISTLTGENHSSTYEAINDSVILKIDKNDFSTLLKSTPKLAVSLSQSLSQRIRKHVTRTRDTQESTIIAVYAPLKDSGSSTYAANLALHLREQSDKKVLLLTFSSDQNDQRINLADIVYDHHKILQSIIKGKLPVDVLSVKFDAANSAVLNRISQFISAPVNDYNYIILDLPNQIDDVVMKTLVQSDIVHLVTMDREKDLEMTRLVIDRLIAALKDRFHADNIQVLISGMNSGQRMTHEDIQRVLNYEVFMVLPHLNPSEYNSTRVDDGFSLVEVSRDTEYAQVIYRLSRRISGVMVGLVLGGGAALGMAHIGVIRALEREGIPIDIVVGSSMGALIGSLWAAGYKGEELEKFGREFEKKSAMLKVFDPILPVSGLVGGEGIRIWLKGKLHNKTFHETKIPLRIVAYDLMHRKEIIIDHGNLVEAVRKSVAIPGVIKPVMETNQMIIDGGVLNPLPTNVLVDMGIKKVIAVNVLQSPQDVAYNSELEKEHVRQQAQIPFAKHPIRFTSFHLARLLGKAFTPNVADIIVRTLQASEYILAEASEKQADVVIRPDLRGINWFELYEVNNLIKRGEESAAKAIPAIKELVKK
ncbi:MAG: patatin-like phospholipase family protein [Candidatus Omnitrophica bacterium]|nr:patatin-like phospholipase family protein [Candidatus Omnitrophota bacterium]